MSRLCVPSSNCARYWVATLSWLANWPSWKKKIAGHDTTIRSLFEAIRQLMAPPPPEPKPEIGFHVKEDTILYRAKRRHAKIPWACSLNR
jgi:hypothetical protein